MRSMTEDESLTSEHIDGGVVVAPQEELAVDVAAPEVITLPEADQEPLGPNYVRLWLATTASNVGDGARLTALPLLAATVTRDPVAISGLLFAAKLPWLLFSLHSGAIIDRVDRRRLIVGINLLRALAIGALAVGAAMGAVNIFALYAVALLQGIGEVFTDNAAFAVLPSIVPRSRLEDANGRLEASVIVANEFAGPALGGILFAIAIAMPFTLDAITFLAAGALIASIPLPRTARNDATPTTIRHDIAEGLRWMWSHPVLRDLSLIAAVTNLVLFATFSIQVLYALEILGLSPTGFGFFLAAEAFGAMAGSMLAGRAKKRLGMTGAVAIALAIAGAANIGLVFTSSWVVAGALALSVSVGGGLWNVITNSFRQTVVPNHLLGRVQSSHRVLSWGAMPLGTLVGGALAAGWGLRVPFLAAGIVLPLLAVAVSLTLARSEARAATKSA